ncbi:MAG: ABC transporter ATP-binding protein [Xanthomonadales bacterium]|nr:ABC transporter ATP-binding protein [Xanthomonadales bacterium]
MTEFSAIAISLRGVTVRLGGRTVLEHLDLDIPAGRVTAVLGPSGAGKTTILRLVTGQLKPDSGEVWIGETRVDRLGSKALGRLRRDIGVLLQNGALFTDLTSFDNVALPLREHTRLPESLIRRLVLMKLEMVGLRGAADLYPAELSGGMKRRVATARAMALDPGIMIYDEPFAGLDPISLGVSLRLIRDINGALGTTSLVITHDVREIARLAEHACIIADRRLIAKGTPQQLTESDNPLVHQFMRGEPDGPVPFHYPADDLAEQLLGRGERA